MKNRGLRLPFRRSKSYRRIFEQVIAEGFASLAGPAAASTDGVGSGE